jgi:hypothetical protein
MGEGHGGLQMVIRFLSEAVNKEFNEETECQAKLKILSKGDNRT